MKKKSIFILLISIIFSQVFAQLGAPKEDLLEQLTGAKYIKTVLGYTDGKSFDFELSERGTSLMAVAGKTILNETNIDLLTELIVKATTYDTIGENVKDFFTNQTAELSGQGQVSIDLAEYVLLVEVSGGNPLYELEYSLEVFEIPESSWLKTQRAIGPEDAKYVIREFSDFQCPYCVRFANESFPKIQDQLLSRDDVRFEFHHFPLISIHPNAFGAAEATECVTNANEPEDFWEYHHAIFNNSQAWGGLEDPNSYFVRLAKDLGLNTDGVETCLEDRTFALAIDDAYNQAGGVLGIRGTPTIFVNGFKILDITDIDSYLKVMKMIDGFEAQ